MKSRQGRAGRIGVACAIAAGTGLTSKPIEHFKVGVKVKRGQVLGQQGKGLWSLFVVDAAVGDAGTLHCWELTFLRPRARRRGRRRKLVALPRQGLALASRRP